MSALLPWWSIVGIFVSCQYDCIIFCISWDVGCTDCIFGISHRFSLWWDDILESLGNCSGSFHFFAFLCIWYRLSLQMPSGSSLCFGRGNNISSSEIYFSEDFLYFAKFITRDSAFVLKESSLVNRTDMGEEEGWNQRLAMSIIKLYTWESEIVRWIYFPLGRHRHDKVHSSDFSEYKCRTIKPPLSICLTTDVDSELDIPDFSLFWIEDDIFPMEDFFIIIPEIKFFLVFFGHILTYYINSPVLDSTPHGVLYFRQMPWRDQHSSL